MCTNIGKIFSLDRDLKPYRGRGLLKKHPLPSSRRSLKILQTKILKMPFKKLPLQPCRLFSFLFAEIVSKTSPFDLVL